MSDQASSIPNFRGSLTFGNMEMGATFTGVARAAFEQALEYDHERKQGGGLLIEHLSFHLRLHDMWRKVEACRALSHRVLNYNYGPHGAHILASVTSNTFVTQNAFAVASEAIQLFGGNGLTREYAVEKMMRDAHLHDRRWRK